MGQGSAGKYTEREKERKRMCVYACTETEREIMCVCMYVLYRDREYVCVKEKEYVYGCVYMYESETASWFCINK